MGDFFSHLVTAIVAAWITVQLSLWRFHIEKLWEKKLEAYTTIIESLYSMNKIFDESMIVEENHGTLSESEKLEHQCMFKKAKSEIEKASAVGDFVISSPAAERLHLFLKELRSGTHEHYYDYLNDSSVVITRCLESIKSLANIDLQSHFLVDVRLWGWLRPKWDWLYGKIKIFARKRNLP